jgi:hypothetical protein
MNVRVSFIFSAALFIASLAAAAPVITGFSPAFGAAGDPILIFGSGFSPGTLVVRFNSTSGSTGVQDTTAFAGSASQINAHVPSGIADFTTGPIFVSVNGIGVVTSPSTNFTVIGPGPYIANFSPTGGAAGTSVTITGAHFTGSGTTTVKFNGLVGTINLSSEQSLTVTAPNGVTSGPITVERTGSGTNTSSQIFAVNPVITSFNPSSGRTGTNVVIKGTNFVSVSSVTFGGVASTNFTANSANQITAMVPPNALSGVIEVVTPSPNPGVTSSNFVVQPTVFGFTPGAGNFGSSVTVTGANFNVGIPIVRFGGIQAAAPTSVTFNSLVAVVPNNATSAPITVVTSDGSNTSSQIFHPPIRLSGFAPTNGPSGTWVRIDGTNFLDTSAVTFNGTPAQNFVVTNNLIIGAQVPDGVITGPIFITTPFGTTNSGLLLFYGAPLINNFTPPDGLPGTRVQINGSNFQNASAVLFNGLAASSFTVTNAGIIGATVPTNAQTGPITVIGPGGTNVSGASFALDYSSDLGVTVTAPASNLLGNDFTYVISVTNKGPFSAPGVVLTNTLPGSVALKSASTSQGSLVTSGNPVTGSLGALGVSGTATVTITVTPQVTGSITNSATVASGYSDPVSINNTSTVSTLIYVPPVLSIQLSNNLVQLSWSASLSSFVLQSNGVLSDTGWFDVPTMPAFIGNQKVVDEPMGDVRFYRLKQ